MDAAIVFRRDARSIDAKAGGGHWPRHAARVLNPFVDTNAGKSVNLIQLLLPTRDKDGASLSGQLAETRRELLAEFGGVTAYLRAAASGTWVNDEGEIERDDVVMVEVVVDEMNRQWWETYANLLAKRFRQDVVHIRVSSLQVISGAS